MKSNNFIIIVISLFLSGSVLGQIGEISFEKTTHDFGQIQMASGLVSYDFVFKNTGNADLKILQVKTSCGCTAPEYPSTNIKPGASQKIKITFNPQGRPGPFHKSITVVINNPDKPNTVLFIKGFVIQEATSTSDIYPIEVGNLRMVSNHLAFNNLTNVQSKKDSLTVFNDSDVPMTVAFEQIPAHIKASINPQSIPPKTTAKIYIEYDAKLKNDYGLVYDRIAMRTNDSKQGMKVLNISARINQDFSNLSPSQLKKAPKIVLTTQKYDFGRQATGTVIKYQFEFKNEGKSDLVILKVKTSCGCTTTALTQNTIKKGNTGFIEAVFDTEGRTGKQVKNITVITNDPANPEVVLEVTGELY